MKKKKASLAGEVTRKIATGKESKPKTPKTPKHEGGTQGPIEYKQATFSLASSDIKWILETEKSLRNRGGATKITKSYLMRLAILLLKDSNIEDVIKQYG